MTNKERSDYHLFRALSDAELYRDRSRQSVGEGQLLSDRDSLVVVADAYQALRSDNERLTSELAAKQARIDALMLEHCPDEMTAEQKAEWAKHQVAAGGPTAPADPSLKAGAPIIRLADKPLSRAQLRALEAKDDVRAIVEIEIDEIIGADDEAFLDMLSERMTGGLGLVDFSYDPVQISTPTKGTIALELDGGIDWEIMGDDDGPGEEDGPWADGWDERKSGSSG